MTREERFPGVVLVGFMGSGKTSVGQEISRRLRAEFVDVDLRIEASEGMTVREIFSSRGEPAFREMERREIREAVSVPGRVVATGGGAFLDPENRRLLREYATVVFLDVSPGEVAERLAGDRSRPLLPGGPGAADPGDPERGIGELMERRRPAYEQADAAIPTDGLTVDEVTDRVLAMLWPGGEPPQPGRSRPAEGGRTRVDPGILTVSLEDRTYDIFFGNRISSLFHEWVCRFYPGGQVFVVTDRNVHSIYGDDIRNWLDGIAHEVLPLRPGEEGKNWEQVREIYTFLAQGGTGRDSLVVAFGGGVVGDLAGFAAATYLRGVPYVQVPTTLLSQVDSSVGGKTGFNLPEGKNLAGSFYQPRAVFVDSAFLLTLDERNLRSGMAEVIKCALAGDAELFGLLESHGKKWKGMPDRDWQTVVRRSVAYKASVVEKDERETSARRVLNLGHTVGHALEQATGYARHLHGEAVGMGLAWELVFSLRKGVTPADVVDRAIGLLLDAGFYLDDPDVPLPSIASAIGVDKKRTRSDIEMPQVTAVGACALRRVPVDLLRRELPAVRSEIRRILQAGGDRGVAPPAGRATDLPGGETIASLEQRVVANPRDLPALLALAEAYRLAGNRPGAWETVKEALHQYPSDPRAQRAARRIGQEFGRGAFPAEPEDDSPPLEELIILEEGAFELKAADAPEAGIPPPAPSSPVPPPLRTITMAEVYWGQGRREEAREIVEGILQENPGDPRALEWMEARRAEGIFPPKARTGPGDGDPGRKTAPPDPLDERVLRTLRAYLNTIAKEYGYDIPGHS